jgi:hypothetical protein
LKKIDGSGGSTLMQKRLTRTDDPTIDRRYSRKLLGRAGFKETAKVLGFESRSQTIRARKGSLNKAGFA